MKTHKYLFSIGSLPLNLTTLEDANRSKMQAIVDYLMDVKDNAKEYNSALYVAGIFSFENEAPIENWLFNSVENLKGCTIELPNWMDVSHLANAETLPLIYSLYGKNRKGEIKYTNCSF